MTDDELEALARGVVAGLVPLSRNPARLAEDTRTVLAALRRVRDAERERIAALLDRDGQSVWADAPPNSYAGGYRRACENNATAIRRGDRP